MSSKTDFIKNIADAAKVISSETGLSYELTLAQAAQETGWGTKVLSGTNNIFNIKADSSWKGETKTFKVPEYINGHWVKVDADFRVYPTIEDALRDRVQFLKDNPRYADLFKPENLGNFHKEATILQKASYATDPSYTSKLEAVFNGKTMQSALHSPNEPSPKPPVNPSSPDTSMDNVKTQVDSAKSTSSPIVLDLNNNGIDTTGVKQGAYFDHANDGFAEQTGWINPNDALLVRDLNNNGYIDNGTELFGNETLINSVKAANGFEALKALDGNHDNQINNQDTDFNSLKLWIDTNGDGFSQSNELHTLTEEGVTAISTVYQNSTFVDSNGNAHKQIGSYTQIDGTQAVAEDIWFAVDKTYSVATTWLSASSDILGLPDLSGYGIVQDLWQAIIFDTTNTLKTLVSNYQTETDEGQRHSLVNNILYHWADAQNIAPQSRGSYVDARQLVTLEHFLGDAFYQTSWGANPGDTAGKKITAAFHDLSTATFAQLEAQTQLADLYAQIQWQWDETTQTLRADFTNVISTLQNHLNSDPVQGLALLDGFIRNLKTLDLDDSSTWQSFIQGFANNADALNTLQLAQLTTLTGSADSERLNGSASNERLLAFGGDDSLTAQGGDDVLEAGAGQDTLEGGAGNDTLIGGTGNDILDGNAGSDVYVFQQGFGNDHIHQYDSVTDSIDTVSFTDLIPQNITQTVRQGDDLTLNFNTGDTITVDGYFDSAPRRVDIFNFANGEHWNLTTIKQQTNTLGTSANDVLYGYTDVGNRILGLEGNDTLTGNTGNDYLSGDAGDDLLYGQSGDDTLNGGSGNDTLKGGTGNDTYTVDSTTDSVVETTGAGIDTVLSSVNYTLPTNVENISLMANTGNLNAVGNTLNNLLLGNEGNNSLSGALGADTLNGNGGFDTLTGGSGNDSFYLTNGINTVTDFQSNADRIIVNDSTLTIGNQNGIIDNPTIASDTIRFSANNELVMVTKAVSGVMTADNVSTLINTINHTSYVTGDSGLFVVNNGVDTAIFKFTASNTNIVIDNTELTLVGILQNTPSTVLVDYSFGR